MNQYINQFRKQLLEYDIQCGGEGSFSALELLWQCYLDMNPLDDGNVREKEETLSPIFAELSVKSADILCDLLYDVSIAYQRAAFLQGVQIGFYLHTELS